MQLISRSAASGLIPSACRRTHRPVRGVSSYQCRPVLGSLRSWQGIWGRSTPAWRGPELASFLPPRPARRARGCGSVHAFGASVSHRTRRVCTRSPLRPVSCCCCWSFPLRSRARSLPATRGGALPCYRASAGRVWPFPLRSRAAHVPCRRLEAGAALLSSVSGPCRYACYLSRGRRALAIFHSARTFQLLFQPAFCKTLPARRQLLFRVILLLHEHKINFSYLFQSQSHSHTSSGEDPAPTAGGRILNELKPLGFYAGGPANASAVLVSAVSQSVQCLMELR